MAAYYRLQDLPGVGNRRLTVLHEAGIRTVPDLLRFLPRTWLDHSRITRIADLQPDQDAVLVGSVVRTGMVSGRRPRLVALFGDGSGAVDLVFFAGIPLWQKRLTPGTLMAAIGRVTEFRRLQLVHPEVQFLAPGEEYHGGIVPVYPATEAMRESRMDQRWMRKLIGAALVLPGISLDDPVPEGLREPLGFLPELANLKRLHQPTSWHDIRSGRRQLKLAELLPPCLRMTVRRRRIQSRGRATADDLASVRAARAALPFELTAGQDMALATILGGMSKPRQFHALLQGDVGSGKTAVAFLAMVAALSAGHQVAYLVPTDILARQQYAFLRDRLEQLGFATSLLVGALKGEERRSVLEGLASGTLRCVVGTHALFSNDVVYQDLVFVVVDEQHRFGVSQREAMLAKGDAPDMLVMSATPIPRSLAMTLYGDLEPVVLSEKPPGRKPVRTRIVDPGKRHDFKTWLRSELASENRAYWIVPRVGEEEDGETVQDSVSAVAAELRAFDSSWVVAEVHGRMDESLRDAALSDFATGRAQILVATTVVEVGVNIPEANILAIDSPERFGLAQLHQLRGRVGRGSEQAWCFLFAGMDNPAMERLQAFSSTEDGFEIAEQDLRFRGAGNLEGGEQSGQWIFRHFDFWEDRELVQEVLKLSESILDGVFSLGPVDHRLLENWIHYGESAEDGVH